MSTIGVAIPVPEPWGGELQRYRVELGNPDAAGIPTHITLLPPVEVEEELLPKILDHLESAVADTPQFTVRLRGTGTFRPVAPVVFVNLVQGVASCQQLASAVRRGPLAVETQFPYHPHVTVAHHLPEHVLDRALHDLAAFECDFPAQVSLYVHEVGQGWVRFRDLPLGDRGGTDRDPRA